MSDSDALTSMGDQSLVDAENAIAEQLGGGTGRKYVRFVIAALSSIPWVGGVLSAAVSFSAEKEQEKVNALHKLWLEEHKRKIAELGQTLRDIFARFENFGEDLSDRTSSDEYLALVKRTFRSWDQADTDEKRSMLQKLITNAGAKKLCSDDLIRLFINWIELYHEAHFMVIKEIYRDPGITRGEIWDQIHDERPREDSAESDLFKYLIRDLSTGGVIRQVRETTEDGEFLKRRQSRTFRRSGTPASRTMESAFEETKGYVLTELGKQFVHYVMEDVVPQISAASELE